MRSSDSPSVTESQGFTEPHHIAGPFSAFPNVSRYVPLGSIADAMTRVCRSIDARERVSLVVGPPGTGKSLLCSLLVDCYRKSHDVVVLGETPIDDRASYQRHLLHHLGADYRGMSDSDLQISLVDRICNRQPPNDGLLIIIDEAQALSADVLEAIRMSTNIHHKGEPRVFAVVVGGVKLDDTLASPAMESFTQRIAARCYLHPMNHDETRHYIYETIHCCDADPNSTITHEAISAVHHACCGVPRLINQIMTEAIDIAEASDESMITEQTIERAWASLQQLPSPMIDPPKVKTVPSNIEFGELGEAESQPRQTLPTHQTLPTQVREPSCRDQEMELVTSVMRQNIQGIEMGFDDRTQSTSQIRSKEVSTNSQVSFPVSKIASVGTVKAQNAKPTMATAKSSQEIFGDFEEEEELCIDRMSTNSRSNDSSSLHSVSHQATSQFDLNHPTSKELESMLHQEIIGIADLASSANFSAMHKAAEDSVENHSHQSSDQSHCEDESRAQNASTIPLHHVENFGPEVRRNKPDFCELSEGALRLTVRDDSDLLIIEEDVDLSRPTTTTYLDRNETAISVDFQSMLQRMRTGTEG